jgi:ligand-binding sensor domain-containing protein
MSIDDSGKLYVVSQGAWSTEIAVFDGQTWEVWDDNSMPIMSGYFISSFEKRGERMVMAGGGGQYSVLSFDGSDWTVHLAFDMIFDVHIDRNGEFWASGISSVSHLSADGWKDYARYSSGISEDFNENILIDSHGRFWVANGNGGIHVFDCPKWQMYGPANQGLYPSPQEMSFVGSTICEDSDGNIWFAYNSTSGTVVKIPNGNYHDTAAWQVFDGTNSPVSWIEESVADGFGHVFFYSDYGTYMYDNASENWTFWDLTNSPLLYYTDGFGTDNYGRVYFGGFQQLAIYDNGIWSSLNLTEAGTDILTVNDIGFDQQNHLWLGCEDGVWMWDSLSWHHWDMNNSNIVANHITSVEFSAEGELWVSGFTAAGFLDGGLSKFNFLDSTWQSLNASNSGLPAEQIDDLEFDALGNLWVNAYPKGVAVYNPNGLAGFECMNDSLQTHEQIVSIEEQLLIRGNMVAYPNPVCDRFFIQLESSDAGEWMACDNKGRIVARNHFNSTNGLLQIEVSSHDWVPGLYQLYVVQGGRFFNSAIVVSREH